MTTTQSPDTSVQSATASVETPAFTTSLDTLDPAQSAADAQTLYRALLQANRQASPADDHRIVIERFSPLLSAACAPLTECCQAQALPWSPDTAASARLLRSLQQEECVAVHRRLSQPSGVDATTLLRAVEVLARQVDTAVHSFEAIPDGLLLAAHRLFVLLESEGRDNIDDADRAALLHKANVLYRYVLLVSIADLHTVRVAQIPAMLAFLGHAAPLVKLDSAALERSATPADFAVDLDLDAPPAPLARLLPCVDGQQASCRSATPVRPARQPSRHDRPPERADHWRRITPAQHPAQVQGRPAARHGTASAAPCGTS